RVDPAAEERGHSGACTRVSGVVHARVAQLRPVGAAVGRLVDAHTRLAAGRATFGLARAEVHRAVRGGARIESQCPYRVLVALLLTDWVPGRIRSGRVDCPTDAAG